MKKRLLTLMLTFVFCVTICLPVLAADPSSLSAADKVGSMERMLYGTEQGGSLNDRLDGLEDDIYGVVTTDLILERIDNLYDYLEGTTSDGSGTFTTKLNVVEWRLKSTMAAGAVKSRIESVEKMLNGEVGTGPLSSRLEELLDLASYEDGVVPVKNVTLPADSLIKVEFTEELSTRENKAGDILRLRAADNFSVNDVLVIPKGAIGRGKIKKVSQPGMFGKDGRIDMEFTFVSAIDGTHIRIYIGELAKQEMKSIAGAAGASIGGIIILGPVGIVGGAFVKGKAMVIPKGSFTIVQTSGDTSVQGVVLKE